MRKKYLSALLFGALLFASAGTFTSCKDYDDDINGLRTEITDLKSAITELQNAVQNGKYVTAVSGNGNVITFTFSDGTTTPITVETESGEPSQTVTIGEDGEVIINGEGTGYYTTKTPTEAEVEAGLVKKGANGTWEVLGEDGEYTDTKIPVSGISVSGSDAEGYTFTVVNANGETQTVKLPSVASAITNIDFKDATGVEIVTNTRVDGTKLKKTDGTTNVNDGSDGNNFTFSQTIFKYGNFPTGFKASDWKGNKALPADESVILSSESSIDVRIDPVGADATLVSYTLTNTKNQDAPGLTLKAVAESGNDPLTTGDVQGRAGNLGNGLYTLSMDNKVLTKDEAKSILDNGLKKIHVNTAYAVNAAHAARSKYALNIIEAQEPKLTQLTFTQGSDVKITTGDITTTNSFDATGETPNDATTGDAPIKVGVPVQVAGVYDKAVYDIYLEVADEDAKFNVTFDQDKHTFTIGQNPDWATRIVDLDVIVHSVATDGHVYTTTVTVRLDSEYNTAADYQPVTHNIAVANPDDNVQYFDLQTMKDGFQSQDDLDSWIKNVNLSGTSYEVFTDEACSEKVGNIGKLDFDIVSEKKTDASVEQTGEKGASANFVRMKVNNAVSDDLTLDKQYYVKVTFRDGASNTSTTDIFNSIVIPVTFTAPTVAEQFTISTNYQNGTANSIKAYYNVWEATANIDVNEIDLVTFFTKDGYDKFATLTLDKDEKVAEYGAFSKLTSDDLATLEAIITGGNKVVGNTTIELKKTRTATNDLVLNDKTNREVGYGKALTITAENKNYANTKWAYPDKAEYTDYTFTVTVLSPIYEGVIAATDGSKNLTVIANSEVGTDITKDMINLTDYANNKYNVVPDASGTAYNNADNSPSGDDIWSAKQIENVWVDETGKNNYIKEIKLRGLNIIDQDNIIPGAITVIAQPIAEFTEPTEVTVHVKDVWGYVTAQPLNMTLIKAE